MGRASKIARLSDQDKSLINEMLEERLSLSEICTRLELRLGEEAPSRSGLGRYKQKIDLYNRKLSQSREVAEALVKNLGQAPESKTARLNIEILHSALMDINLSLMEEEEVDPKKIYLLSKSLESLARAEKSTVDLVKSAKEEALKEAAEVVEDVCVQAGLSDGTVNEFKSRLLGISNG